MNKTGCKNSVVYFLCTGMWFRKQKFIGKKKLQINMNCMTTPSRQEKLFSIFVALHNPQPFFFFCNDFLAKINTVICLDLNSWRHTKTNINIFFFYERMALWRWARRLCTPHLPHIFSSLCHLCFKIILGKCIPVGHRMHRSTLTTIVFCFRAHVFLCEHVPTGKPVNLVFYQSVWSHSHWAVRSVWPTTQTPW